MVDTRCSACGVQAEALQRTSGFIDRCECGGERERVYSPVMTARAAVHGDDIPGGITFRSGICNEDGTPRTYYTKHDIREATAKAGLRSMEESGTQTPIVDAETDVNLHRKGFENPPRIVAISGVLTPEDEAKRIAHWWAQEAFLKELDK